jgi:hypothetical protein
VNPLDELRQMIETHGWAVRLVADADPSNCISYTVVVTLIDRGSNPHSASTQSTAPANQTSAPTAADMSPTVKLRLIRIARQAAVDAHGLASFVGTVHTTDVVAAQHFADTHDIHFALPSSTPVWMLQVRGTFNHGVTVINILVEDDGLHPLASSTAPDSSLDLAQLGAVIQLYPRPDSQSAGPSH